MDGQRFDAVTKALAAGTSRRAVLRTALGGMGAGLLALVGVADAGAASKRSCAKACKQRFRPGRARGQCISACARGNGGGNGESTPCGSNVCGAGEFCCNESCGICAPIGGGCTEQFCGGEPCGDAVCGPEEFCCNPSCGICAPMGGVCTQQFCE